MSQRPGSFVNAAGILSSDNPADVVRKLDAAWEADMVEATARRMFEQQADKLAVPWERQWEPTKAHWRTRAIEACTPAAPGIDLEQFREAVQGWRDSASNDQAYGRISRTEWFVIADRADRLLALIDASPKGGSDSARLDWLESEIRHYGDGHTEPREAYIGFNWQQTRPGEEFPGLRAAIDAAMLATSAEVEK